MEIIIISAITSLVVSLIVSLFAVIKITEKFDTFLKEEVDDRKRFLKKVSHIVRLNLKIAHKTDLSKPF